MKRIKVNLRKSGDFSLVGEKPTFALSRPLASLLPVVGRARRALGGALPLLQWGGHLVSGRGVTSQVVSHRWHTGEDPPTTQDSQLCGAANSGQSS